MFEIKRGGNFEKKNNKLKKKDFGKFPHGRQQQQQDELICASTN
jgi:hypothetical protein